MATPMAAVEVNLETKTRIFCERMDSEAPWRSLPDRRVKMHMAMMVSMYHWTKKGADSIVSCR